MSSAGDIRTGQRAVTRSRGMYERFVCRALSRMPHGSLTMHLPDGTAVRFGSGSNPRHASRGLAAEVRVVHDDFFRRCFYYGDIGLGEAYVAGDWESSDLAEVIAWFILNAESSPSQSASRRRQILLNSLGWLNNLAHRLRSNSIGRSRGNIAAHYDLSNEFFSLFLDPSMTYSSAIFNRDANVETQELEEAQRAKFARLCRILALKKGDRVLEIGSGWGAFSRYVAHEHGCHVTAITISREQFEWAKAKLGEESLEDRVDLRLLDYRQLTGRFDKIVSVEMLEAVGHRYLPAFFSKCHELLAPNGLLALQVITCPDSRYDALRRGVDFIQKHIFPGGLIPSIGAIIEAVRKSGDLTLHDLADFGDAYATTLERWSATFEQRRAEVRALGFDEMFIRKWRYYLQYCIAGFAMRHISVVQMLFTRPNNHEYRALSPE